MLEFKSTREGLGEALLELAEQGLDVVAISADTSKSMGTYLLKEKYNNRAYDCGIAEQNMMMIAAGLASTGRIVFAASYSVFTSMRALEQIRTFICYPNLNVKIIAGIGGFSGGIEGVTHMALEDLGIIRCIPNINIVNPSDFYSTKKVIHEIAKIKKPFYVRIGRDASPVIFKGGYNFEFGKANLLINNGNDIGIITSGLILSEVLNVAKELSAKNIGLKLLEVPTLKPIDEKSIINLVKSVKNIFTIEEHNIIGGLFSAVSEILTKNFPARVFPIAVPDIFTESGKPSELLSKFNLDKQGILNIILQKLN